MMTTLEMTKARADDAFQRRAAWLETVHASRCPFCGSLSHARMCDELRARLDPPGEPNPMGDEEGDDPDARGLQR